MSLALKFSSLAIRTFSKPIANYIKRQAREHEGFKQTCVAFAQALHRVDMRWRIGLLQDSAALERQAAREAAKKEAERKKAHTPTVKTQAQTKAEESAKSREAKEEAELQDKEKHSRSKPRIKPLSETKAIESGANFISESFLFGVAASLILFESWRSSRKASKRREDIADRLNDLEETEKAARRALIELEREVLRLRAEKAGKSIGGNVSGGSGSGAKSEQRRILPKEIYDPPSERDDGEQEKPNGWLGNITQLLSRQNTNTNADTATKRDDKDEVDDEEVREAKEALATNSPGPAEKMLVESDRAIDERRKQREAEAEAEANRGKPSSNSKASPKKHKEDDAAKDGRE